RYINVGVGNEKGIFFMTSPKTDFYQQLVAKPEVSITGMAKAEKGIEVIRVSGSIRNVGKEHLQEILKDNPYVHDVYPHDAYQQSVQALQLLKGQDKYQHLQNKIVEHFEFDVKD